VNADGDVPIYLASLTAVPAETVTVSGTATGLQDTAHLYTVNYFGGVDAPMASNSESTQAGTAGFSMTVPRGVPFALQAFEHVDVALPSGQGHDWTIYGMARLDLGPIDADQTGVVLDFATNAVPTSTADVSMLLPTRAESPLREGAPYCFVCAANSYYCEGWPTHLDISADGNQFEMTFLWYEPPNIEGPNWFCQVSHGTGNTLEVSQTLVDGYPQTGGQGTLIDVPRWITPSDPETPYPLHDPLQWEWFDADIPVSAVAITRNQAPVWYVMAGPDATTITVPELPSTADAAQILGSSPRAVVYGGVRNDDGSGWVQLAQSLGTRLAP
jgi:hypothetical protein